MIELSALQTKAVDLSEGHWVSDIPGQDGLELCVRSENYRPYKVASTAMSRRAGKKLRTDEGVVDYNADLGGPLAEHIVVGWKNLPIQNKGKPLPFSKESALAVLTLDDDYGVGEELRNAVVWAMQRVTERLRAQAGELAGN